MELVDGIQLFTGTYKLDGLVYHLSLIHICIVQYRPVFQRSRHDCGDVERLLAFGFSD